MGTDMGPVWVSSRSTVSMSSPSFGVKVSLRETERPATIRPGGWCSSRKKLATSGGKAAGRKELNELETLVRAKVLTYVSPASKSRNSSTGSLGTNAGPRQVLPHTVCSTTTLSRWRCRAAAMYRFSSTERVAPLSGDGGPGGAGTPSSHSPGNSGSTTSSAGSPRSLASSASARADADFSGDRVSEATGSARTDLAATGSGRAAARAAASARLEAAVLGYLSAIMSRISPSLPRPRPNFQSFIVTCCDGSIRGQREVGSSSVAPVLVTRRM
mmetsp:Transcript_13262/g.44205  ORF Transcript_13262/g.44205 Transcript_13262/m.44205 type:complete len:272 (+) Transcript_13262:3366-4181(+)